jgi:hypothetical protein
VLKRQRRNRLAVLISAANTGEGHHGADIGAAMRELLHLGRDIECFALQSDGGGHGSSI